MLPVEIKDQLMRRSLQDVRQLRLEAENFFNYGHLPTASTEFGRLILETKGEITRPNIQTAATGIYLAAIEMREYRYEGDPQ
jgi:hypothetical protein